MTVAAADPDGHGTAAGRRDRSAFGIDFSSPFVPVGVTPRYPPPRANIKPSSGGSWLRRVLPVALSHKAIFSLSLVASFVGLIVQVLIPNEVRQAIDTGLSPGGDLTYFVAIIVVLGCFRFVLNYASRLYMLKAAYRIEYDLRNIIYEHLSRMSFPFYDRVQSGQLISRGNSDIRQVQMYLAMAPTVFVQCGVAVLAFALMLTINVPARVRGHVHDALRPLRRDPHAPLHVPGLVADPVPAGRGRDRRRREHQRRARGQVVRRRGAAAPQADRGRPAGRVGVHQGCRHPRPLGTGDREPAPARPGPRAAVRRLPRDRRSGDDR